MACLSLALPFFDPEGFLGGESLFTHQEEKEQCPKVQPPGHCSAPLLQGGGCIVLFDSPLSLHFWCDVTALILLFTAGISGVQSMPTFCYTTVCCLLTVISWRCRMCHIHPCARVCVARVTTDLLGLQTFFPLASFVSKVKLKPMPR